MTQEDYTNIDSIIEGNDDEELNVIESLINIFTSPIAKRKGVTISSEDCATLAKELKQFLLEQ